MAGESIQETLEYEAIRQEPLGLAYRPLTAVPPSSNEPEWSFTLYSPETVIIVAGLFPLICIFVAMGYHFFCNRVFHFSAVKADEDMPWQVKDVWVEAKLHELNQEFGYISDNRLHLNVVHRTEEEKRLEKNSENRWLHSVGETRDAEDQMRENEQDGVKEHTETELEAMQRKRHLNWKYRQDFIRGPGGKMTVFHRATNLRRLPVPSRAKMNENFIHVLADSQLTPQQVRNKQHYGIEYMKNSRTGEIKKVEANSSTFIHLRMRGGEDDDDIEDSSHRSSEFL
eukprot:g3060.t1